MGKPLELARGNEYASNIFNAVFGDYTHFEFNGNVRNLNLIDNLPHGCCVEVPAIACRDAIRIAAVGALPPQLALLNNISARCEELAIEGFFAGDPHMIYRAILFDPLTSAVLSLAEIRDMVNEMFEANREYLGYFRSLKA
ncbi:Alpha-galactosidase [bioreactor metagenome]|uniref:Alpha-galactosidase n=1 Tax=bioreactor metagenome TaxID=1076179 RepID=A0A645HA17_9ZZZZ